MKFLITLLTLAFATSLLRADEKKPPAQEAAIRQVLDDQVAAWNRGDLPGFMKGYWNSQELTFYSGKEKQLGWDAAFDRYKKRYQGEGKEMGKLSFSELEVQLLGAEVALVKGRWRVELKKETLAGLFTLVMKATDKGWVIVHDHTSS